MVEGRYGLPYISIRWPLSDGLVWVTDPLRRCLLRLLFAWIAVLSVLLASLLFEEDDGFVAESCLALSLIIWRRCAKMVSVKPLATGLAALCASPDCGRAV